MQADISTATPEDVGAHALGSIINTVPEGDLGTTEAWRRLFDAYQHEALSSLATKYRHSLADQPNIL